MCVCVKQWLCVGVCECLCANERMLKRTCVCVCLCNSVVSQLLRVFLLVHFFLTLDTQILISSWIVSPLFFHLFLSHLGALNFSRNIMVKWAFSMLPLLFFLFVCRTSCSLSSPSSGFCIVPTFSSLAHSSAEHHLKNVFVFPRFFLRQKCNFILSLSLAFLFIFFFVLFLFVPSLSVSTPWLKNTHSSSFPSLPLECTLLFFPYYYFVLDSTPFDSVGA